MFGKIRVGLQISAALGPGPARSESLGLLRDAPSFWKLVERSDQLGFDSLWLSQRLTSEIPEPMTTMAAMAARTTRLKMGTSVLVLSAYNPVIAAKALATIDVLSNGRVFPAVGIGASDQREIKAIGIQATERGARLDEAIVLMRRLWTEERVTFQGQYFHVRDVSIWPRPVRPRGIDLWVGGHGPAAQRRVGHFGDGWLPAYVTPEQVRIGIESVKRHARDANRHVPEDHYGVVLPFTFGEDVPTALQLPASADTPGMVAHGSSGEMLTWFQRYIDAGATKFVLTPMTHSDVQLERIREELAAPLEALSNQTA